jgi:hypothetical protein
MNPQSYDDLKTEIIKRLGNRQDLSTRADQWINDAFTDLAQSPKATFRELDALWDFTVVAGQSNLDMPGDFWFVLSLRMIDRKLDQVHWQVLDRTYRTQGMPTRYARYQNRLEFDPVPDKSYDMTMRYRRRLPNLVSGMQIPIEREWHEILVQLTVAKGLEGLQRFEEAAMYNQAIGGSLSSKLDNPLLEDDNYESTIGVRFR